MATSFINQASNDGLHVKLWRGERMCLIGMDVDQPEDDFVGFAIEVQAPGASAFVPLNNRLAFSYDKPLKKAVTGGRWYPSLEAPFQKFRWIHFPDDHKGGNYTYRVTKMHMPKDGPLVKGVSVSCNIALDSVVYDNFLEIGFTRNFASSQAYAERYKNSAVIIPTKPSQGLKFPKVPGDVYQWLGFEAYELIFNLLKEVQADPKLSLDVFAYDFNEPDILKALMALGKRVRIIIDNSGTHASATSAESLAAKRLVTSAGADNVKRMKFIKLQHNKVFIVKSSAGAQKVLFGSTNFSFRGLYIQANNAMVVHVPEAAAHFETVFNLAFKNAGESGAKWFKTNAISQKWQTVQVAQKPSLKFCFSPHADSSLSMSPVAKALSGAKSSAFFSIAFLYQTKSGLVRAAIDKLEKSKTFSYGISDKKGELEVYKPDGSLGIVDFAYLAKNSPSPFSEEWSGGSGINQHDKFVVTDFNLPTATVFTGSSNLAGSGEEGNGDNLVMIQDQRVATSYAIEALRIFDHLHFRVRMQDALGNPKSKKAAPKSAIVAKQALTLQKPTKISGKPAWYANYYKKGSAKLADRELFAK